MNLFSTMLLPLIMKVKNNPINLTKILLMKFMKMKKLLVKEHGQLRD